MFGLHFISPNSVPPNSVSAFCAHADFTSSARIVYYSGGGLHQQERDRGAYVLNSRKCGKDGESALSQITLISAQRGGIPHKEGAFGFLKCGTCAFPKELQDVLRIASDSRQFQGISQGTCGRKRGNPLEKCGK